MRREFYTPARFGADSDPALATELHGELPTETAHGYNLGRANTANIRSLESPFIVFLGTDARDATGDFPEAVRQERKALTLDLSL
jgi:hypothetical protein